MASRQSKPAAEPGIDLSLTIERYKDHYCTYHFVDGAHVAIKPAVEPRLPICFVAAAETADENIELGKKALATYQAFRERIVLALQDPGALRYRTIGVASIPMRNMAGTEYAVWDPEGFHSLIFNRDLIGIFTTDQLCSIRRLHEDKSPGRSEEELPF